MPDPSKNSSSSNHGFSGLNGFQSVESVKSVAYSLGFDLVGIAPMGPFTETNFYSEWLDRGYAVEMKYLERQKPARLQPESILPGARSVIVCAMNYNTAQPYTRFDRARAWISRYAWGLDYHETLKETDRITPGATSIPDRYSNGCTRNMRASGGLERIPASSIRKSVRGCFLA